MSVQPFTAYQYQAAIESLQAGMRQLAPDGYDCSICGDTSHQAFECGHNPLVAMRMCAVIARHADELHDCLHFLAGYNAHMGHQVGPANVIPPQDTDGKEAA